ncbi:hypothetical protein GWG54_11625 [Natronococcus sp. JC468]|uniref:DUF7511 domain-containing protein n=1 Tax=Natronococcus sp. JC468 TaxID=1961921 RepID=UPI00143B38EC|nr:hypothetical protein [Natronococcus sp. JC468]NKE36459.1 hypothetical protein [Natronococcus sp. JC468]
MRELSSEDDASSERASDPVSSAPTSASLDSAVVSYEDRADRRTVFPVDCPDERKLTAWLSANATAFVDLEERR